MMVALTLMISGLLTTRALPAEAATLPSIFCEFEEPFRWVVVSPEGILVEDHDDGAKFTRYQPTTVRGSINSTIRFGMPKGSVGAALVVTKTSGGIYEADFAEQQGSCTKYPNGYVVRTVIGVAVDDALNIRAAASASSDIVGTLENGELVFVQPSKSKWWKAAFIDGGDDANVEPRVVSLGWVSARFIDKKIPRIAHE